MGASGLWTVTRAHSTRVVQEAHVRDPLGQGLDQVDRIALHGGLHRRHETSVVDGVRASRRRPPPARVSRPRVRSTTKTWPSRRSKSKTPWWPKHSMPVHGQLVASCRSCLPSSRCQRPRSASRVARTSCTRRPHTPRDGQQRGQRGVRRARARRPAAARRRRPAALPRNDLRLAPTSSGQPERREHVERRAAAPSCARRVLAKPRPGVEHDPLARRCRRPAIASTRSPELRRTDRAPRRRAVVVGEVAHPVGVRAPVHRDVRRRRCRRRRRASAGRPARRRRR